MRNSLVKKISYVAALIIPLVAFPAVKAIASYDVTTPREVTVTYSQDSADFANATINAHFYQICAMNSDGSFTTGSNYENFTVENTDADSTDIYNMQYLLDHSNADDQITSDLLLEYASGLTDYITSLNVNQAVVIPDAECLMTANASGQASGKASMVPGLYLIVADDIKTSSYEYKFTPVLAYVPETDTMELKAEKNPLTADLIVEKTLTSFANLTGTPIFVFDVEAVDPDGKLVYSDVVSISFDKVGTKSVLVKGIPAGSTVTVTEIYSGASYNIISNPSVTMVLNSAPADDSEDTGNTASFTNDHNDHLVYGTGVVNHFEVDNSKQNADGSTIYSWSWSSHADNTDTENGYTSPSVPQ